MISVPLSLAVILSFICGALYYVVIGKVCGLQADHLIGGAMVSGIVLSPWWLTVPVALLGHITAIKLSSKPREKNPI